MNRYLTILFFLISSLSTAQQFQRIDSLKSRIDQLNDKDKIATLLGIAWAFRKSHPDSTIYYSQVAIQKMKNSGITDKIPEAVNFLGVAHHYKGNVLKSVDYYNQAMDEALARKDSIQYAHSLNSLGRTYLDQGSFLQAYDYYFTALNIFKRHNDLQGIGYAYKSLAELYQTQNKLDKALAMSQKTLDIRMETSDHSGQISILMEIAKIYQAMHNFDRAFDYYLQAKEKAGSLNDKVNIAIINSGISDLYSANSKWAEAKTYAEKALNAVGNIQNLNLLNDIHLELAEIHYMVGDYDTAKYHLDKVFSQAHESDVPVQGRAHFYMAKIFEEQGNFEQAYHTFKKYTDLQQKLNSAEVARTIEKFESRIELGQREKENEVLLANRSRDQAMIERQRTENEALIIISITLGITGIILLVAYRNRRQVTAKLQEKNTRIESQGKEIILQNEKINEQNNKLVERNKDLAMLNHEKDNLVSIVAHDLKSPFNRIKGLVELLKATKLKDEQQTYIGLLEDITAGSSDLIRDLLDVNAFEADKRKPEIIKIDIYDVILQKMKSFYSDAKAKNISLYTPEAPGKIVVESDAVYLSRILDNLISNAIKFSNKNSQVILSAGHKENYVYLSVKDFGQGFSDADKKFLYTKFKKLSARPTAGESSNGLGLAIVKTLVGRLDAEIELISSEGEGSEFVIKIPAKVEMPVAKV